MAATHSTEQFVQRIRAIWESARGQAVRSVNSAHVQANWLIGQQIVEAEQAGEKRADYGKQLLKGLSERLNTEYGRGFSVSALQYMRAFHLAYPNLLQGLEQKQHAVSVKSPEHIAGVLHSGFAFVGRQVRLSLDGDHFYPDLVFYHIKLKCYVVVDLKLGKLNHADLGQMQLYVNYYDREISEVGDNPTVGLVLCSEKNDAVVRYVLDEKQQQIFASRYQLYMPTEEQLKVEIQREKQWLESSTELNQ